MAAGEGILRRSSSSSSSVELYRGALSVRDNKGVFSWDSSELRDCVDGGRSEPPSSAAASGSSVIVTAGRTRTEEGDAQGDESCKDEVLLGWSVMKARSSWRAWNATLERL